MALSAGWGEGLRMSASLLGEEGARCGVGNTLSITPCSAVSRLLSPCSCQGRFGGQADGAVSKAFSLPRGTT